MNTNEVLYQLSKLIHISNPKLNSHDELIKIFRLIKNKQYKDINEVYELLNEAFSKELPTYGINDVNSLIAVPVLLKLYLELSDKPVIWDSNITGHSRLSNNR